MPQFFDYNPMNNTTEYFDFDQSTGQSFLHTVGDVEPVKTRAKELRNSGLADEGIKKGMWHYAYLPPTVILELRAKGINVLAKHDGKALMREINTNYPYLKTTDKRHDR